MNTKQMLKIAIAATVVITNIASLPHVVYAKDVTNQSTSTAEIQSEVETLTNTVPTITGATEITIKAGDVFDVLTGISASDSEDGDLTSSIKVEGSVNPN
ncbi:MAG: immunoglobulin-like domain-containing protein, partial [Culicoidibacterales bacterium]